MQKFVTSGVRGGKDVSNILWALREARRAIQGVTVKIPLKSKQIPAYKAAEDEIKKYCGQHAADQFSELLWEFGQDSLEGSPEGPRLKAGRVTFSSFSVYLSPNPGWAGISVQVSNPKGLLREGFDGLEKSLKSLSEEQNVGVHDPAVEGLGIENARRTQAGFNCQKKEEEG